jgi:hypothetical protein
MVLPVTKKSNIEWRYGKKQKKPRHQNDKNYKFKLINVNVITIVYWAFE